MNSRTRWGLTIFAMVFGLFIMTLYTTLVEDVFFKNVAFCSATGLQLLAKGTALTSAGLITGFLASLLVLQDNHYPNIFLSVIVPINSFFFVGCAASMEPFWYGFISDLSLIVGLWLGYFLAIRFPLRPAL